MIIIAKRRSSEPAPFARILVAVVSVAKWCGQRAAAARKHRTDMAVLASLDERMLADMGITRADVRDAIAQPMWRDPTRILADRRSERHVHDYRAIFTQLVREQKSPAIGPDADAPGYPPLNRPARLTL
jgi:uncharacterized protein YjiS (DUF1127 family)